MFICASHALYEYCAKFKKLARIAAANSVAVGRGTTSKALTLITIKTMITNISNKRKRNQQYITKYFDSAPNKANIVNHGKKKTNIVNHGKKKANNVNHSKNRMRKKTFGSCRG